MKRPLVYITLVYVAGLILGEFLNVPLGLLILTALAISGAALLLGKIRFQLLWPMVLLAGWSNNTFHRSIISSYDLRVEFGDQSQIVTVRGKLHATPKEKLFVWDGEEKWRTVAEIEVNSYKTKEEGWKPVLGSLFVTTPDRLPANFFKGQIVEVQGVIARPRGAVADGLFDFRAYLQRQGIFFQLKANSPNDWSLIETGQTPPLSDRFIAATKRTLSIGLPEDDTTRLLWTLVLDWKAMFTDEAEEPFMRAGTYHIFAVDGLRIAIVAGILLWFFRFFRVPRAACGLIIIPMIWFYTGVTDWPTSAIRASIMMTIVIGSWALKRPGDLINSLFAAALIILMWEPQQLFQAGFQLSFFVVLCIALLFPVTEHLRKKIVGGDPFLPDQLRSRWQKCLDIAKRYMLDTLVSSWAAWIGSIPLAAYYFHLFTPVSTPSNFVVVPLTFLTLISCLISMLFWWAPPIAAVFNNSSWGLMKSITWISQWSVKWPGTFSYVSAPSLLTIATFYLFLLTFHTGWFWKLKRKLPMILVLSAAAVLWIGYEINERKYTRVHILPLSGGHAVFVDTPNAKDRLLVDCGNDSAAEFTVKPFLRAHGVNELPHLLLTHGDLRYIGGAEIIAKHFTPREFIISPLRPRSSAYRDFVDQKREAKANIKTIGAAERYGVWSVLHPELGDDFSQADDAAVILKGDFGLTRIFLGSDLGRKGQRALLERTNDLGADILVTGLPRQEEPISEPMIAAINPKVVVVADAELPATERAPKKLQQRLANQNRQIIYGHDRGATVIEIDSSGYRIDTARTNPN